jgi:hypothetical protein
MTLFPLPPGAEWGDDPVDGIEPIPYGWRYLQTGATLWSLVDADRAARISAVLERAVDAGPDAHPWFETADVEELVELLSGLEEALIAAGVMNELWFIPPDRAGRLAAQVPAMDTSPDRSDAALSQALAEVLAPVTAVRTFLAEAAVEGCAVVLD